MNRPLKLSLAVALALGSSSAFGLGLGSIQVRSGLNEPLIAEIPVIESSAGEAAPFAPTLPRPRTSPASDSACPGCRCR